MKNRSPWERAIVEHCRLCAKAGLEACGAVVRYPDRPLLEALPLRNVHPTPETNFRLDPAEWGKLIAAGVARAYYHGHPAGPRQHSDHDKVLAEEVGLPCYLYSVPDDELTAYVPKGWSPPLEGRTYMAGVNDCFSLVRDWHRQNTGIEIELPARTSEMMVRGIPNMEELVERNRLVQVAGPPIRGDILVMHLRASGSAPNHMGVHLGDGTFLHQLLSEPSGRAPWGGFWEGITALILRHETLLAAPKPVAPGTEPDKMHEGETTSPP